MGERTHTPGPWTVFDDRDGAECPGIEALGGKLSIVVFGEKLTDEENCGVQGRTVEESRANANLIAAAPEMFAALQAARQFIANGVELGFIRMPGADTPDPAHDTLPAIEAALSKASPHV